MVLLQGDWFFEIFRGLRLYFETSKKCPPLKERVLKNFTNDSSSYRLSEKFSKMCFFKQIDILKALFQQKWDRSISVNWCTSDSFCKWTCSHFCRVLELQTETRRDVKVEVLKQVTVVCGILGQMTLAHNVREILEASWAWILSKFWQRCFHSGKFAAVVPCPLSFLRSVYIQYLMCFFFGSSLD